MRIIARWIVLLFIFYISSVHAMGPHECVMGYFTRKFNALRPHGDGLAYAALVRDMQHSSFYLETFVVEMLQRRRFGIIDKMKTSEREWRVVQKMCEHKVSSVKLGPMWYVKGFANADRQMLLNLGRAFEIRENTAVIRSDSLRFCSVSCVQDPLTEQIACHVLLGDSFRELSQSAKRGCLKLGLKTVQRHAPWWHFFTEKAFGGCQKTKGLLREYNNCMEMEAACWITLNARGDYDVDLADFLSSGAPGLQRTRDTVVKIGRLKEAERALYEIRRVQEVTERRCTTRRASRKAPKIFVR